MVTFLNISHQTHHRKLSVKVLLTLTLNIEIIYKIINGIKIYTHNKRNFNIKLLGVYETLIVDIKILLLLNNKLKISINFTSL